MRLAHVFLVLVMTISGAAAAPDLAPPFEHLSDGRIGVEIFGQKIALPADDAYLDLIQFYPLRQRPFGKSLVFTLRQALVELPDPTIAFAGRFPGFILVRVHLCFLVPVRSAPAPNSAPGADQCLRA